MLVVSARQARVSPKCLVVMVRNSQQVFGMKTKKIRISDLTLHEGFALHKGFASTTRSYPLLFGDFVSPLALSPRLLLAPCRFISFLV